MKILGGVLTTVGSLGLLVAKFGIPTTVIAWLLGLLGIISYVSFWWVSGMLLTLIISLISTVLGLAILGS